MEMTTGELKNTLYAEAFVFSVHYLSPPEGPGLKARLFQP